MWRCLIVMDSRTYENWKKIKATFEESGNTDNQFYKRAVQILKTGIDPFDRKLKPLSCSWWQSYDKAAARGRIIYEDIKKRTEAPPPALCSFAHTEAIEERASKWIVTGPLLKSKVKNGLTVVGLTVASKSLHCTRCFHTLDQWLPILFQLNNFKFLN